MWFRDVGAITERDDATGYRRIIGIVEDITERKNAQEALRAALAQKDRLMRELNHRVKNSLQMAMSLVRLKDEATGVAVDLSDVHSQINAIATIHEKLHQDDSIGEIDVGAYIRELLSDVFSLYSRGPVTVDAEIYEVTVPTDTATHLGLVVNELATNAMKYGFDPEKAAPRFTVDMTREGDWYVLTVSNNGRPFPSSIDLHNSNSLGLQLVSALVAHMGGTVELQREPTPVFTITIRAFD
jgi:two-component sensor histidine kinase